MDFPTVALHEYKIPYVYPYVAEGSLFPAWDVNAVLEVNPDILIDGFPLAFAYPVTDKINVAACVVNVAEWLPLTNWYLTVPLLKGVTVSAPSTLYPQLPELSCPKEIPGTLLYS